MEHYESEDDKISEVRNGIRFETRVIAKTQRRRDQIDREYDAEIEILERRKQEELAPLDETIGKSRDRVDLMFGSLQELGETSYDGPYAKITTRKSKFIDVADDWTNEGAIEPFTITRSTVSKEAIKKALKAGDLEVVNNGQIVDEMGETLEGVRQVANVHVTFRMKDD